MPDAPPPLVRLRALRKRYAQTVAVDGVDLEVAPGEIVGLLGPNGAGKTTTLECLLGLLAPDSGEILLDGIDVRTRPAAARRRVGAQIQPAALQDKITPREALTFFASFYPSALAPSPREAPTPPVPGAGNTALVDEVLARFALLEKADSHFDSLSSGQRQRLSVALAFVNRPVLLVLDEPTTGLDPHGRRALHQILGDHRAAGGAVLLSTHDLDEAQRLCDRVAVIHHGRLVATGRPAELIARAGGTTRIVFQTERTLSEATLAALPSDSETPRRHQLRSGEPARTIAALTQLLQAEHNELLALQLLPPSLEDAFVALTGERWDGDPEARL